MIGVVYKCLHCSRETTCDCPDQNDQVHYIDYVCCKCENKNLKRRKGGKK